MLRGKTEKETLDLNGWGVGDVLEGDEGHGPSRILITTIGEELFLGKWDYKCDGEYGEESGRITLAFRNWKKVEQCDEAHKDKTLERKILERMALGSTGLCDEAMAYCALNLRLSQIRAPHDPCDFNRCLILLYYIPEIRISFPKIACLSVDWRRVITNWDILEKSFLNEAGFDFSKRRNAPITYQLMKDLRAKR
ncbi:MAG: DUF7241 domain-containing protein [Marinomonas sp.]|jgi:hypothetical protein|uniref:DUF7241 domain-containing protein n=1 Tax=Marinomonas sp. TaxID=1904862 RepID=UPI003F99A276